MRRHLARILNKAKLAAEPSMVFLEDCFGRASHFDRATAALRACLPLWLLRRLYRLPGGEQATCAILFSSGSTATPKGIVLTHRNLLANIDAVSQVYPMSATDRIAGVLPFFHSFGFNFTLWFPLTQGIGAVYHANPLDAKGVGDLVQTHHATILLATPTFCGHYTKGCSTDQFASLRLVLVGAEPLRASQADAFRNKFGIEPMEGYGVTEMAPVIAVNQPDSHSEGLQRGGKRGTVGRPLPAWPLKWSTQRRWSRAPRAKKGYCWCAAQTGCKAIGMIRSRPLPYFIKAGTSLAMWLAWTRTAL